MKDLLRPYADVQGIFNSIEYRANATEAFEKLDVDTDVAARVVRVDDLRTIPTHQLRITLDLNALKPHYDKYVDKVSLLILVRDTTLRREIVLADHPVDAVPSVIDLDRGKLRLTGMRDVLPLNIVVLWKAAKAVGNALPTQRASRLAELQVVLRNTAGGATFPYKRVTAEELKKAGLPAETAIHLKLYGSAVELLKESDTPVKNLFEVWVHEKVWAAIQNDKSPPSATLRLSAVTLTVSNLLLSAILPHLKEGQTIEERSAIGQLLSYVEKQAGKPDGQLRRELQASAELHGLEPYLQNAWRFVSSASKVEEEAVE